MRFNTLTSYKSWSALLLIIEIYNTIMQNKKNGRKGNMYNFFDRNIEINVTTMR